MPVNTLLDAAPPAVREVLLVSFLYLLQRRAGDPPDRVVPG